MENIWSLLKRCINGTWVSVEPFYLFRYLDEQAYRYNERRGKDGDRFFRAINNILGKRLTYKELKRKVQRRGRKRIGPLDTTGAIRWYSAACDESERGLKLVRCAVAFLDRVPLPEGRFLSERGNVVSVTPLAMKGCAG